MLARAKISIFELNDRFGA